MIEFKDGPAAGVVLRLRRCPIYLRVVQTDTSSFDALDQLDDQAQPCESIHVYRRVGQVSQVHVCARGKDRHLSGWHQVATYVLHAEQPSDDVARDNALWAVWATEQHQKERTA